MDQIDRKILDVLQRDTNQSIADIGSKVGLSQTPCWKRIQRLERLGIIQKRVALLDASKLDLSVTAFVTISVGDHSEPALQRFRTEASRFPEVLDIHRMAGEHDYILRVVLPTVNAYDTFYRKLIDTVSVPLKKVTSHFAIESVKATTALPIIAAPERRLEAAE
ncbi:Lrp/AsnC family transcriptional regulator [Variibacter gotjawalensis]|uniref:Lrp/AsnC family transcriptional regulator n=1 Tax=Variibacter gotjawalensis TaxID=1333996 RepID=UPI000BBB1A83|nr:Lrp/AsnC family transcriptional regulator [Variibacter gotjawalensis]